MHVEIVNHCYRYSRLLAYQLSSLIIHAPNPAYQLTYSLFYCHEDKPVVETALFFQPQLPKNINLVFHPLTPGYLRNRAVGRNAAAKCTQADWVWFTDTDYAFIDRVWDDLAEAADAHPKARFFAPLRIKETDWPTGDKLIEEMKTLAVRPVPSVYIPDVRKPVAIGGIQIAHGPTVRECGYAPQIAASGESDEWNFRSDIRFRQQPEMRAKEEVFLHHVVRIRHTNKGYGQPNRHEVVN